MRLQALVLKKIPIREYDELIVCYTKNAGKQVYHAKSVLRPTSRQSSHLDVLNLIDFSLVEGNGHPIITSAYSINSFPQMKNSLPAMAAAYFLLECFDKLIFEGDPDSKLWNFLLSSLEFYEKTAFEKKSNWPSIMLSDREELLKILGYSPNVSIEELANSQFRSLQFARKVLK